MNTRIFLAATLFALVHLAPASAKPFDGATAALTTRDTLIEDIAAGKIGGTAEAVVDRLVRTGIEALAEKGKTELAARYLEIWEHEFTNELSYGLTGIGDHAPLSTYLVDLCKVLSRTLGKDPKYKKLLNDLNTMNYAIPVVFTPRGGEWGKNGDTAANRNEYRLHFVPFSGIVTYYSTYAVCVKAASAKGMGPIGEKVCPQIATRLEEEMRARLAPKLSDYIFNRANGVDTLLDLSARDFQYRSAEILAHDLP